MTNEDPRSSPSTDDRPRRYLLPGALISLVIVGLAFFVTARDDERSATSGSDSSAPVTTTASTATAVPNAKNEVVMRLQEILQIRERAFTERDASLFDDIYTSTCPCLRAGRGAIAALKKEKVRWRDRSISIEVQVCQER